MAIYSTRSNYDGLAGKPRQKRNSRDTPLGVGAFDLTDYLYSHYLCLASLTGHMCFNHYQLIIASRNGWVKVIIRIYVRCKYVGPTVSEY